MQPARADGIRFAMLVDGVAREGGERELPACEMPATARI